MITIENRSAFFVTVPKHSNLDRTEEFEAYVAELSNCGLTPMLPILHEAASRRFAAAGPVAGARDFQFQLEKKYCFRNSRCTMQFRSANQRG